MANMLNFDAVTVGTIDITKGGQTYHLKDDVETETLLRYFKIQEMRQVIGETPSYQAIQDYYARVNAEYLDVCTIIFQHTFADMTEDDVAKLLTPKERQEVCKAFFSLLFRSSGAQPSATDSQAAPVAADGQPTTAAEVVESAPTMMSQPSSLPASAETPESPAA